MAVILPHLFGVARKLLGLIRRPDLVLDDDRLHGCLVANQKVDVVPLAINARTIMIETAYLEPLKEIRQVFSGLPGRLPVIQQRREKPGVQIDFIVFAAQDREYVERFPATGFVPVVNMCRFLQ